MDTIVEHINSAGRTFVEFALPMLIQSGVLIVILLLLDLLLRKKVKAVFRYWIWMLVLLKLILPTSLSSPLSLGYLFGEKLTYQDLAQTSTTLEPAVTAQADISPGIDPLFIQPNPYIPPVEPVTSVFEPEIAGSVSPPQVPVTPLSWHGVVFLVWLAVAIAMGLLLLQRALFVRGLVAQSKKAGHLMNDALSYCCASMGIKSKVGLKVSVNATTPSVCGLIRPVILVPWKLTSTLGASRLRTILMHELAHIRRGDLWVNLAQTALQIIYFYNPLLWLANCVIRRIREQAVDEAVLVAMGEKAQKYPQTLVDVAKMAFKRPALGLRLIGVVESKSALAGRIKHILGRPMPKTARLGIVGVLAVIIAGAVLLPMAAGKDDGGAAEDIAKASEFMATLPNDVTVELVGVCEHPSEGKQWWLPDGRLLGQSPVRNIDVGGYNIRRGEAAYELVAKLTGPETLLSRSSTPEKWKVSQARKVGLGKSGTAKDKSGKSCLRATTAIVKNGLEKIDIEFGLAGVWEKRLTISSNESSKQKIRDTGVVINPPYEKDSNAIVTIKIPNKIDSKMAINITAVLKNGKVIGSATWNRNSKIRFMRSTDNYEFHGINLSDVDHFEIYTSKYQWVEFKNVSLRPDVKTDVPVAYSTTVTRRIRQAGKPDSGRDETYEFLTEPNRKTRLLTPKERVEIDNWVSIAASVVKDNGRYLLPEDEELTLSELVRADGYDPQKIPVSFLEIMRPVKLGQVRAYSIFSRNLETLFSKKESDPVLKRHDNIVGGYVNPAPNRDEFLAPYSFGDVVELIINDDNSEKNMFVDLDAGKLVTPDEDLDKKDLGKVLKWMSANGIDAVCNTSPEVGGLIGFGMVALSVDNYFWDADIPDFWDRLIMRIDSPVLISATHVLPATYLIKTSEYKMGILQILGFTDKPEGVRIRYKLVDKGETERPDVHVGVEESEPVLADVIESARAGISLPIRKIFSGKSDKGGSFEWETSIDPRVRFRHGWYSVEGGVVKEYVGAGASKIPEEGRINLKLDVEVKDNILNLKVQRVHDLDDGRTAAVTGKTSVPDGAYLKQDNSIDSDVLTNKHLNLWQGDFIRDDKVVKTVIYAAYLTTPDDQETVFKPPVLQKEEFVKVKFGPDVRLGIESNISPKLVMMLGAINSCAAETELNIESISITARNIEIKGDTSGRTNTRKFIDATKENELEVLQLILDIGDNREKFSMIVEPKKDWQQWWQQHETDVQLGLEENISPKLVMLLQAIADCVAETELSIESISIKGDNIKIEGDTSSRKNTLKFLDAVKKNELEVLRLSFIARDNRNKFRIEAEPKENWQKWWQQHKTHIKAEVPAKEDVFSTPPKLELLSASPPIFAYDAKLNFADPTVRDGSFHSEQSVAFSLSFHNIEIPPAGKFTMSRLLIGQTTWPVHLEDNGITIKKGVAGQKVLSLTWPAGEPKFEKVIKIPVKYGQKEYSCPVHVELDRRNKEAPTGSYWFCAYLSGRLPWGAGGRGFEIVNLDQQMEFRLTGDGTDPRDAVLGIDINGDGRIDPAKTGGEQFDLYEPFQIGPKTYRLAEVDPYLPRVVFRELVSENSLKPPAKTDVQVEDMKERIARGPEQVQAIDKMLKEWFGACVAGDVELMKKAYSPGYQLVERDMRQINELLGMNPGWGFSLLSAMWNEADAMAVSVVLEHGDPKVGAPMVLVWTFRNSEGKWGIVDIDLEELKGLQIENSRFMQKHPNSQVWFDNPDFSLERLSFADAPRTTKWAGLPDLFEERTKGSESYHIRKDVDVVYSGLDGTVYYIPKKRIFYVQHDKLGSSTLTYYGPFKGDPHQVLGLETDFQAEVEQSSSKSGGGRIVVISKGKSTMYSSIQEAIDAAPPGLVIRIGPGVYKERLEIDKPLTLEGAGWDQTTIVTENNAADVFEEALSVARERVHEAKSEEEAKKLSAELQAQFEAEMKEKLAAQTHLVSDTENVVIRNLKLTSPGQRIEGRALSVPIIKFSNARALVSGCAVVGTPGDGINIVEGSDVQIRDCLVAGVGSTGIAVTSGRGDVANARIINCDVRNCYHRGITIGAGCDSTVVRGCRISGSSWHGIRYDNASPSIVGNLIFANVRCGIYASGETAAAVRQNLFYGNEMTGIACWYKNRDTIEENTFVGNKLSGLGVLGASRPIVRKNIFYSNPTAVSCGDISGDSTSAASDGTVNLEENLFWGFEHKVAWRHPGDAEDQIVIEEVELDEKTRNVVFDPEFKDITTEDYSLRLDSPARRSGIGAAELIDSKSPWPIQDEEIPIIPEGDMEDTSWMGWVSSKGKIQRPIVPVANKGGKKLQESIKNKPRKQEGSDHPGGISGVVVNSATGEPIVGAYVGVGDFGDSGGSNYSRHRSEGFHDKTKTDEQGRFELDGLAFTDDHTYLKVHPLVVTHPDFVRYDEKIELLKDKPAPDVKVSLRPAAKIDVTIVDADGDPLDGQWLIRLEALDGRRFIPPGSDPHLSSFASSIWAHMPDLRANMGASNGFTFTELDSGEYSIEAIRFHLVDNPTPENIWKPTITYHGAIPSLKIQAGQSKQVQLSPADYQTSVSINMPQDPIKKSQIPPFLLISRNTGLLLWNDGKAHGPEDHRLGRLQKNALYYNLVVEADVFTIENLPPGSYSVFAGPVYFMSATRMEVSRGREVVIDMPPIQITEHAKVGLWTFDRKVKLQARDYSVSELCEILTSITESNPRIIADTSIENEKLSFGKSDMSIWDVLEKLYLDRGWKVEEGREKTLIIRPG